MEAFLLEVFKLAANISPFSFGVVAVLLALTWFLIKATPSIVKIIQAFVQVIVALGDKDAEKEIKRVVNDIRTDQLESYAKRAKYELQTDGRLDLLEKDVGCIRGDLKEIKGNCQNFHKEG